MSHSPKGGSLPTPRCCNDDAVQIEDGTWICVWCSSVVDRLVGIKLPMTGTGCTSPIPPRSVRG